VSGPPEVVLYSRRSCHLCDEARSVIEAERARTSFPFREVFVDGDDDLERAYGLRVPVVTVDDREEFEFAVDPGRLGDLLWG
jgi:glutaredoxin